ncbi:hypothetical protein HDE_04854 [Halotydeus destructor]|nr:hypothetical protein HDE_04854 [Halotydeus destructor]
MCALRPLAAQAPDACLFSIKDAYQPYLINCLRFYNLSCDPSVTDPEQRDREETACALACYKYKSNYFLADDASGNTGCIRGDFFIDNCVCGVPWKGTYFQGQQYDFLVPRAARVAKYAQILAMKRAPNTDSFHYKLAHARYQEAKRSRENG